MNRKIGELTHNPSLCFLEEVSNCYRRRLGSTGLDGRSERDYSIRIFEAGRFIEFRVEDDYL